MIGRLLNQTITVYPKSSYNRYGREVVGTGVDYPCRITEASKSRLLPNGQVIQIDAVCHIEGDVGEINDKAVYNGHKYKILNRKVARGYTGNAHHSKMELVKWQET